MALSKIVENSIADSAISASKLKDFAAAVDLNGVELVLDADADTSITADTDDRIDFKIANTDHISIGTSSGDTVIKAMVDAKDIKFQQFDGRTLLDINDGGFVGIENGATGPGVIRIFEDTDNGSNYVGLSVGNVSTAYTLVFPNADGSSGQALTTNGSGVLSFSTVSANTPTSADGQALGSASLEWSDLFLADSSTIQFGADQDTILTHTDGAGLTLNSTNKLMFNDASQFIQGASATVLDIAATDEIELTATLIEIVGNSTVSGTLGVTGVTTSNAGVVVDNITIDGTEIDLSSGDLTIDVAGKIILDADGADILLKDAGTQFGALRNTSGNLFIQSGTTTAATFSGANVTFAGTIGSGAITSTGIVTGTAFTAGNAVLAEAELELLDGLTAGTAIASKVVTTDANIDSTGMRNLTISGELDAATLDVSGDIDVDGTANLDAVDIDGAVDIATTLAVGGDVTFDGGTFVFNEAGADKDFRVESSGNSHMIFVDAGQNHVNIGQAADTDHMLNVGGNGFFTTGDNTDTLTLESTDADANSGPVLCLHRNSGSPANSDLIGRIDFSGESDAGAEQNFAVIKTFADNVSHGSEDGQFTLFTRKGGSEVERMTVGSAVTCFNDGSADIDFRIESNNDAHMFFLDAGNNNILFGDGSNASPAESSTAQHGRISSAGTMQLSASGTPCLAVNRVTNEGTVIDLRQAGGARGSISVAGATATFNTTSDYRLKENVDYDWDATTRLKQLKPARFNFIEDDTNTLLDGFIAHEVSSVVPIAVKGEKDATVTRTKLIYAANGDLLQEGVEEADWTAGKASGKYASDTTYTATKDEPDYQQLDHSKLVPLLVKTVQELEARIKTLEDA